MPVISPSSASDRAGPSEGQRWPDPGGEGSQIAAVARRESDTRCFGPVIGENDRVRGGSSQQSAYGKRGSTKPRPSAAFSMAVLGGFAGNSRIRQLGANIRDGIGVSQLYDVTTTAWTKGMRARQR